MVMSKSVFGIRGVLLATVAMVSACAEPDEVLRGERESIYSQDAKPSVKQQARAFSAPSERVNSSWEQAPGVEALRTSHAAWTDTPDLVWSVDIGEGDTRRQRITSAPVAGGDLIYVLDSTDRVSAVTRTGNIKWQHESRAARDEDTDATGGGLAYHEGVIYISSGFGVVTALDAKTGSQIWQQTLEATGSGQPTIRDGLLYLVAGDETGWVLHTDDGRIAWQVKGSPTSSNILGSPAPVVTSDLAIFAFGSGDVIATFRKGGLQRWLASVSGKRRGSAIAQITDVAATPFIVGNRVYIANQSGRTAAFDLKDGTRVWTAREGATGAIWVAGGSVFQVSDQNKLLRIDANNGEVIWSVTLPKFIKDKPGKRGEIVAHHGPILASGRLVVASNDGLIRMFDPVDGSLDGQISIPNGATTEPIIVDRTLYVLTTEGELAAYR